MQRPRALKRLIVILLAARLVAIGAVVVPPLAVQETAPSLSVWTAEIPLAALALTSPVRSEKQLHAERAGLKKVARLAASMAAWERPSGAELRAISRYTHPNLPRRSLPSEQTDPSTSDDPSH